MYNLFENVHLKLYDFLILFSYQIYNQWCIDICFNRYIIESYDPHFYRQKRVRRMKPFNAQQKKNSLFRLVLNDGSICQKLLPKRYTSGIHLGEIASRHLVSLTGEKTWLSLMTAQCPPETNENNQKLLRMFHGSKRRKIGR